MPKRSLFVKRLQSPNAFFVGVSSQKPCLLPGGNHQLH